MPTTCRLIPEPPLVRVSDEPRVLLRQPRPVPGDVYEVGPDEVHEHAGQYFAYGYRLSDEYVRDHLGKRLPLIVCLPNGELFCPDAAYSAREGRPFGPGWTVTGEAPAITVHPSINCVGRYHGWLHGGVLSDDVEGRVFD